ncbi:hypothetical protein V8D89_012306 [Ganoderma adspersum]
MPVLTREIVKEALLVGIDYATNTNLTENGFQVLTGAHKDTMTLRKLLIDQYDYRDEDITILIDSEDEPSESQPTRENIIRGMENLVAGKQAGDHIVFAFSGHGGQVTALVEGEEIDGLDEVLLPIDCTFDPEVDSPDNLFHFIRDNDIRDVFVDRLAPGVRCTMIFDCCHSGTASDLPCVMTNPTEVSTPESPLFSPPITAPRTQRSFARMDTLHDGHVDVWFSTDSAHSKSEVTSWSACLDEGITFGKKTGGIFMKAFTQVLNSTPNPTNKELLKKLRTSMLKVTQQENRKLERRRQVEDISSRGSDDLEDYVAPRPQLGSLRPESSLLAIFTL